MKAYSGDLRERDVAVSDATREWIAVCFSVSVIWIRKPKRQPRQIGSMAPKPRDGDRARVAIPADFQPRPRPDRAGLLGADIRPRDQATRSIRIRSNTSCRPPPT